MSTFPPDSIASQEIHEHGEEALVSSKLDDFHQLDPSQITVSRIASFIATAIIGGGVLIGTLIAWGALWFDWTWSFIPGLGLLLIGILIWMSIVWPIWEFNVTRWKLSEVGLEIRRGVFWKHQISVPYARVQHADVSQGPLQRRYGLGKLTVHTAGTQNASVELEGVSHVEAIRLRDEIVRQRKVADVV